MIGFIANDSGTMFEIWPIYGSEKGIPNWSQFRTKLKLPHKIWGENGVAFSGRSLKHFTIWWSWGHSTYPRDFDSLKRWIKKG